MEEQLRTTQNNKLKLGTLPDLNPENIDIVEKEVMDDPVYGENANDSELKTYFKNHRYNTNRDIVIHKIMLIDYTNSTQLQRHKRDFSIFALADRILDMENLDEELKNGDIGLVPKIAKQPIIYQKSNVSTQRGKASKPREEVNLLSFASKFCHYHNRICYNGDAYSIFDHVVAFAIAKKYWPEVSAAKIEQYRKNYQYEEYSNLIFRIIQKYKLGHIDQIRYKLDHFLWYPNKDYYYSKNKNK